MKLKYIALLFGISLIFTNVAIAASTSNGLKSENGRSVGITYTVNIAKSPTIGAYLVGANGMTLYYLEGETDNNIKCNNNVCLSKWPIFHEKELAIPRMLNAKDFKIFKRTDGKFQISYDNKPLYYFAGDKKPGDTYGNDLKTPVGIWHIIQFKKLEK